MPSYRRDRPGGRPPLRPRSEEAEEEPEERRPFRRTEYASRPITPEARRSGGGFWDVPMEAIVPESERRDPNFDYSRIFERFSKNPRAQQREEPRRAPEREESRREERAPRPEARRPEVDPSLWLDLNRIWSNVERVTRDQRFRRGVPVPVERITAPRRTEEERAGELIRFFRIPEEEVRRYSGNEIWSGLLHPFLDALTAAINRAKPREIQGQFFFQEPRSKDGSLWLTYME